MNLLFVTHNEHKLEEAAKILPNFIALKHLGDIGYTQEIPETRDTLEGNALQKAETVRKTVSMDCFSDDTGLFIHALNGNPGVHSAHYAGPDRNDRHNRSRVLSELENARDRTAYFKTVIALLIDDEALFFEGVIEGKIAHKERGEKGFGYDSIFVPDGYDQTFAEMDAKLKNTISHRALALQKLQKFLLQRTQGFHSSG